MARRSKVTSGKYALIGMIVSKFVIPAVKKQAKKRTKAAVKHKAASSANAVKGHPARTGIAVGVLVGAASYVAKRVLNSRDETDGTT